MAVVTVSVSFGLHQSNGGLSIYIGSTKKSNSEKPNVKFFTVAPSLEVIFKVALSKGASIETFCTSWPPGGAVWQLHTWNPLVLWVTGIWFEGGQFWAAQSRKINFFGQKLKPFESPDTLTYKNKILSHTYLNSLKGKRETVAPKNFIMINCIFCRAMPPFLNFYNGKRSHIPFLIPYLSSCK